MAYDDLFRVSVHAVITNTNGDVLLLKSTYGGENWGLPGGALDPEETVHEALIRECREELGVEISIMYLSGIYFHKKFNSQACIFKCEMAEDSKIKLSSEHSEFRYFPIDNLSEIQKRRVLDCLNFDGKVKSAKF